MKQQNKLLWEGADSAAVYNLDIVLLHIPPSAPFYEVVQKFLGKYNY